MKDLSFLTTGDGARLAYRFDGSENQPVLMLSNSIGTTLHMWDGQIEELSKHFRVLRYDIRGHGSSDAPAGAYSLDRMGRDVIELLDALSISRVHFLGISFGGLIGQWLGIHAPERINRLILSNTSSYLGPASQWDSMIASVLQPGALEGFADMFLQNWFPAQMLGEKNAIVETFRAMLLSMQPQGFAGSFAAIRDADLRRTVALISSPTLVIVGQHDTVTLPGHGELIATTVPGAQLVTLPAVHLSNIQFPSDFLNTVLAFLLTK